MKHKQIDNILDHHLRDSLKDQFWGFLSYQLFSSLHTHLQDPLLNHGYNPLRAFLRNYET